MTDVSVQSKNGLIVTFYSFKGGAGRSMALANVAWILASNGHRVLVVDWDLESPGLHRYFHPFLIDKSLDSSIGVLELLQEFAAAALQPDAGEDDGWFRQRAQILPYAMSLEWRFPGTGTIDFVPSGQQTPAYSRAVSTFDWDNFYGRLGGATLLDALRENMRANYDYVLLDSRTGLSDIAGICTVRMPDIVVDCFTLSSQSIEGAAAAAHSIIAQAEHPIKVLPVVTRTDASEKAKLDAGRETARARFATMLGLGDPEQAARYWAAAEIPYVPYYAFEEILAPFGDTAGLATSLLAAFERLTATVTDGAVTALGPMDERARQTQLAEFERTRRLPLSDLSVSYAARDRLWAEWVRAELTAAGFHVGIRCAELDDLQQTPAPRPSPITSVFLLSQEYAALPQGEALLQAGTTRDASGRQTSVGVLLDGSRLPVPFDRAVSVDVSAVEETLARNRLLTALGQTPPSREASARAPEPRSSGRFPGTIPRIFTVPQRNDMFTGRAEMLEDLRDRFSTGAPELQPQVLFGLGGVGKTQIAIEYAHRFAADYDLVHWIPAEQPGLMRAALARLAPMLDLPQSSDQTADLNAVLQALRTADPRRRWLLIFDNIDDPETLAEMLPAHGHGHVLITSRTPNHSRRTSTEVTVFKRDQSVTLLRRRSQGLALPDADKVAELLGDLPLAIEQAGAWLAVTGAPVETYLHLLETQLSKVLSQESPDYPRTAAATWLVSLNRLREQRPAAARLMELCACFASEPIPTRLLLREPVTSMLAEFDPELRDPMLLAQVFQEVARYSLARVDSVHSTIEVHRLVQVVIREQLDAAQRAQTDRLVLDVLVAANPQDTDDPDTWPQFAELWPHVSALAVKSDAPDARLLVVDMVRYLWRSGDRATSRELAERAIARWRRVFGEDDRITLVIRDSLSNAYLSLGEFQKAVEISEDVVERLTRTLGTDHPSRLIAVMSLTGCLNAVGQFARARTLNEEILEPAQRAFGENHGRALNALNNVAHSARLAGDYAEASLIDEQVLERRRATLGPMHPHTLTSVTSLGRDLREHGDYSRSRAHLQSAVDTLVETLGKDRLETIRARNSLAVTLRKLGEFNAAYGLSTAALDRATRALGPAHPDYQAIALNLACDESALNRHENAAARTDAVLERYRQQLGEKHCFTLIAINNLSIFTRLAGRREDALALSRRACAGLATVFDTRHPSTLLAQVNHGNDLYDNDDVAGARALDEDTYRLLADALGERHPETLAAGNNLAISREAAGDIATADSLRSLILSQMATTLGEQHPNYHSAREGRRLNCDIEQPLI
jgi:hypothetical protein